MIKMYVSEIEIEEEIFLSSGKPVDVGVYFLLYIGLLMVSKKRSFRIRVFRYLCLITYLNLVLIQFISSCIHVVSEINDLTLTEKNSDL